MESVQTQPIFGNDESEFANEQTLIPDNENPWKIILAYADDNLELNDKLALRLACTDANKAAEGYVTFSEDKFNKFLQQISKKTFNVDDKFDAKYDSYHMDEKVKLEHWLELERKINDILLISSGDLKLQHQIKEWLTTFILSMPEYENVDIPEEAFSIESLVDKKAEYTHTVLKRPSFKKSVKKFGKGIAATGTAVTTVVSIPLGLLSLPLFFGGRGSTTGSIAYAMAKPLMVSAKYTFNTVDELIKDKNLRNIHYYVEINKCIKRIKSVLL